MSFDVKTYSAADPAIAVGTNPTDVFTITGANGGIAVKVQRLRVSGIATAAGTAIVRMIKRSTADSGGTSTTLTAVPHDSTDAAAVAVVKSYTANPTVGNAVGDVRVERLTLPLVGVIGGAVTFDFGNLEGKPIILRGTSEQLCLNLNGAIAVGGNLSVYVEWTEE